MGTLYPRLTPKKYDSFNVFEFDQRARVTDGRVTDGNSRLQFHLNNPFNWVIHDNWGHLQEINEK